MLTLELVTCPSCCEESVHIKEMRAKKSVHALKTIVVSLKKLVLF